MIEDISTVIDDENRVWYKSTTPLRIPNWSETACCVRDENNLNPKQFQEMVWYLSLCESAGFAKTDDQIRLCSLRWVAGKRKISPPGTTRKKKEAQRSRKMLLNVPKELMNVIEEAILLPMVKQYLDGNEKVFNSLFGFVMKKFKAEPQVVRELLTRKLEELKVK